MTSTDWSNKTVNGQAIDPNNASDYIKQNIIPLFEKDGGINNDLQTQLTDMFNGVWDDLPVDEYVKKAQDLENQIKEALGKDTDISKNFTLDFKWKDEQSIIDRMNNSIMVVQYQCFRQL